MAEKSPQSTSVQDLKSTTQLEITKELLEGFLYGKKRTQLVDVHGKETRKRKWEGVEEESSRKLQSLWCEECCKHIQGECPVHQSSQPKLTYAVGSFPPEVRLCTSSIPEYTYGACAAKQMPRGTWIGPYEGRRVYSTQTPKDKDNTYVWEIYSKGQLSHFIDGSDENTSSWMRFIRCARHKTEQNMSVIQYGKNIYYYAIRDIEIGEEMLVWYHESYYQFWGVPLALVQELDEKNGPPVPPGILQPIQMQVPQSSSPNQPNASPGKPTKSPEVPQQYGTQKSFQFPKKSPTSKGYSPPARQLYPRVSSHAAQHPPPGALHYPQVPPATRPYPPPNVSAPYPPLSKGATPYQPLSNSGIPYPPPARNTIPYPQMPPQSTPYSYPPQSRYPTKKKPGNILYQPTSTQYQVRPSQASQMAPQPPFIDRQKPIVHSMGPPNVQVSRISPTVKSPPSSAPHRVPTSPQRLVGTQIPQQLSPESRMAQDSFSRGLHANQQAVTESSHASHQPTNHSPHAVQQPVIHSSRAEQQPTIHSSRGQRVRAYYETDNYTSRADDRSSTSSENDQWAKGEVKENMPLGEERDNAVIDPEFKNAKHPQALKTTPLQNLNPSIHNKRPITSEADKQHNQVSSTVRTIKDQEISWTCGQCGQMFAQQVTLRMHVCPKAPENPFHCGHCSNTFSTSSELREHVVTHSNERPFKCGFCGRSFAGATTLGNHMRTHTGQRPYECKVCGQTFAIATQLSRHLRPPGECGLRQKEVNTYNQSVDIAVEQ